MEFSVARLIMEISLIPQPLLLFVIFFYIQAIQEFLSMKNSKENVIKRKEIETKNENIQI